MKAATPALTACAIVLVGCAGGDADAGVAWDGSREVLASGQVVVRNSDRPLWRDGEEWRVEPELRIGRADGDGPDIFGRITSLAVDDAGRFWVLDGQAQELRVFAADGAYLRTVGRRGGGPGEFAQAVLVEQAPDGDIWVMDPTNARISVFDTAGTYLRGERALGGFVMMPWPGGFDAAGRYLAPVPQQSDAGFRVALVRHDAGLAPVDTLFPPRDPVQRERFEHCNASGGCMVAGVPYQGGLLWRVSPAGNIHALVTDEYRIFELDTAGDTVRTITRAWTPPPVTAADRERAREDLEWFTRQGGQIDLSKLPRTKPAARSLFFGDAGELWVERVLESGEEGRVYDVFDGDGRFLGAVTMPFTLRSSPPPRVLDGVLYGVAEDDLGVQYVVRARVAKGVRNARGEGRVGEEDRT